MPPDSTRPQLLWEAAAWKSVDGVWQPLYGNFQSKGISIEWHEFSLSEDIDWSKSFHPGSLEICLNYSGKARFGVGKMERHLAPEQVALYTISGKPEPAIRIAGHLHRFMTLELSAEFLRTQFSQLMDGLKPEVLHFMEDQQTTTTLLDIFPMVPALLINRIQLLEPPVFQSATPLWYQSKVSEILSHLLFKPDEKAELFCQRQDRLNRERCERVFYLIERDLENPPSLEMLAKEVQCSPFHLSRIFAREAGMSIPKYLRIKRIEKACEYLASGKMNVTEAAMAVGYSSLSAFNKAFVEQVKVCPGLYPLMKHKTNQAIRS